MNETYMCQTAHYISTAILTQCLKSGYDTAA